MNRYKLSKAGIDANEGIKRFNNKADVYEKFLMCFPEDMNFQRMCKAIEEGDVKEAFQCAHALKGMAGNISLTRLHNDLLPLVEELRSDSLEKADELLEPVRADYEEVIKVLTLQVLDRF